MVVDGKGQIFEDRRKVEERRKDADDTTGKRKTQRRKNTANKRHGE